MKKAVYEKSILVVQFRTDDSSKKREQRCIPDKFVHQGKHNIRFHFLDAFDVSCGWHNDPKELLAGFDGVILGGSSDFYFGGNVSHEKETVHKDMIDRVQPFVQYLLDHDFPTLGICFGHQMLGYFLGAKVVDDPSQAESGSFKVCLSGMGINDNLFQGLSDGFVSFFMHRDSIESLPDGAVLLARGPKCCVGAFRYKKNIYGVQFHPELNENDVESSARSHPEYINKSIEDFMRGLQPMTSASLVLVNFSENIASRVSDE